MGIIPLSIDRLARSSRDLLNLFDELKARGVRVEFTDTPFLNTGTKEATFVIQILSAVAELERVTIKERQAEGIAIAKAKGVYEKEPSLSPEQVAEARERVALGVPKSVVARELGVSRRTLYNALDGKGVYGGEEYRKAPTMRAVDLFCGFGGMSLGFSKAGFDVVAAFDNWKPAIDVYRANLKTPAMGLDLSDADVAADAVRRYAPDIVIRGPPCQDFSIAGNRDEDGGMAELTLAFADIVTRVRPRCFVMENVPTAKESDTYAKAFGRFREAGYGLTVKVLDASLCGVPQARERCFTVGILGEDDDALASELESRLAEKQMTVRDYLGDDLGTDYYFCMPRSYKRRGIFSIDEPAATVRGMNRPMPSTYKKHPGDACDPSDCRALTEEERGWLQTFPKGFQWKGSKADVNQMIGNAVPVNMARFVAEVLKAHLNGESVPEGLAEATFGDDVIVDRSEVSTSSLTNTAVAPRINLFPQM